MLQDAAADAPDSEGRARPREQARDGAIGPTVARLLRALGEGDVLMIASTEQRGETIARAAAALTDARVLWCPPPDALPGADEPSSPAVAGKRVAALSALRAGPEAPTLFITDASAAARKLADPAAFTGIGRLFRTGDRIDPEPFGAELESIGYVPDERVDEPGEFAVRGAAIDLFPAEGDLPVRIHVEDGRVSRITPFDPSSQLSEGEDMDALCVHPALEPATGSDGTSIFDHLPTAGLAIDPEAAERRARFVELAKETGGSQALLPDTDWRRAVRERRSVDLDPGDEVPGRRFIEMKRPDRAALAAVRAARETGNKVLLAGSARDVRFLSARMERQLGEAPVAVARWSEVEEAVPGALLTAIADLDRGWAEPGLLVIATADVLGARAGSGELPASFNPLAADVEEFHIGDAVIHEEHGLGILKGVESVVGPNAGGDAIRIEYAAEAQRLVPIEEADRLWRYGAEAEAVRPDRLDGSSWEKRRSEIDAAIAETARQLVHLAAEREARAAPVLDPPVPEYERFASGFPFTETADQLRAIEAVRADLSSGKPMDRLVVGDVGYGKTEVALRAAAAAVLAGKQVALVAPTTVLVRQHQETFARRLARIGVDVAALSRLTSPADARAVKKGLADASIRMVVGTQALAGKGVQFGDLGLVIIDEEQRFGAADKARLRALATDVHVLTLTATPIPRTLQTALVGLQQLSLITTPPARRLPTRTVVASYAAEKVKPALLRENRRGGQSFVVVPRIEDMAPMAERLARLVPDLKLRQAHGKMPAAEIDEAMIRFASGDGDVLLATNIIEAGLDIPRANTMLIWRADRFGLAQLHQLRGRVGRGRVRGELMLLTEAVAEIAPATLKRLRALEALDQLGAGFAISARDLDLRGAGELLGVNQTGHLKLIGLGLYQHLLGQAVRSARGETVDDWAPELHVGSCGRLPEEWIPEAEVRINLYVRIARASSPEEVDALADELEDRFGSLPGPASMLLEMARIRQLARQAGIARIDAGPAAIALTPRPGTKIDGKAAGLIQKGDRLLLGERIEGETERLARTRELLETLSD